MVETLPLLLTGVGIPAITQWIKGGWESFKKETTLRDVALASMVGLGIAYIALSMTPPVEEEAAVAVPVDKSVSNVTVQLGRYAGGIRYPGQLQSIGGTTDGSLVYID
ncbi:MAG: hypothetical protein ACTSUF_03695 [Candidatus Heimdallarchaeaceae archaeon]